MAVKAVAWRHGFLFLIIGLTSLAAGCASSSSVMMVSVPVVDLRAQPHTRLQPGIHDPSQETQVLYGERIRRLRVQDEWTQVQAVEQPEFTHANRWQGYPGWLPAAVLVPWNVSREPTVVVTDKWATMWEDPYLARVSPWRFPMGTRLHATNMGEHLWKVELHDGMVVWMRHRSARSLEELRALAPERTRQLIIEHASTLVGDAYVWGGRSPYAGTIGSIPAESVTAHVTGPDCSGLVNLAYRAAGLGIPRDAHEQFLRARSVTAPQPADLIFLSARDDPKRIIHVLLYAGEDQLIEGPGTGLAVRRLSVAERFGQPLDGMKSGATVDGQTVRFGTYLE